MIEGVLGYPTFCLFLPRLGSVRVEHEGFYWRSNLGTASEIPDAIYWWCQNH